MDEKHIKQLIKSLENFAFSEINEMILGLNYDYVLANTMFIKQFYKQLSLKIPKILIAQNPEDFHLKFQELKIYEKPIEISSHKFWVNFNASPIKISLEEDKIFTELAKAAKGLFLSSFYAISQMVEQRIKMSHPKFIASHPSLNINYHAIYWLKKFHAKYLNLPTKNLQELFSKTNIFWSKTFENTFLYCPFPKSIHFDENNLLHAETSAAISWEGFDLFAWRGIEIPKRWILNPETINNQEIIGQKNAELRRIMQEVIGSERFAHLLGLQKLDEDYDLQGNLQTLYKTAEIDSIAKDYLYFARVACPSTGRIYFLGVPPGLNNIWDAVAWTFGKTKETYKPIIET
jgi:hypothetical protein